MTPGTRAAPPDPWRTRGRSRAAPPPFACPGPGSGNRLRGPGPERARDGSGLGTGRDEASPRGPHDRVHPENITWSAYLPICSFPTEKAHQFPPGQNKGTPEKQPSVPTAGVSGNARTGKTTARTEQGRRKGITASALRRLRARPRASKPGSPAPSAASQPSALPRGPGRGCRPTGRRLSTTPPRRAAPYEPTSGSVKRRSGRVPALQDRPDLLFRKGADNACDGHWHFRPGIGVPNAAKPDRRVFRRTGRAFHPSGASSPPRHVRRAHRPGAVPTPGHPRRRTGPARHPPYGTSRSRQRIRTLTRHPRAPGRLRAPRPRPPLRTPAGAHGAHPAPPAQPLMSASACSGLRQCSITMTAAPTTPALSPATDETMLRCSVASGSDRW